jgi:serine/threonine protein kinase
MADTFPTPLIVSVESVESMSAIAAATSTPTPTPTCELGLPTSMEPGPFGRGSFARAYGDRVSPNLCHVVIEVNENPMTLGNALSSILHAPRDARIRIVTNEDALVAVVTQPRGIPLSKISDQIHMENLRSLMRCVLAELAALHAVGRAHTDVKPANIIYHALGTPADGGRYRLIDQGSMHDGLLCERPVYHPTLLTTPDYRPPWIGEGANDVPVDASKLDVWSFGATVLSLLTGEPFCALPTSSPSSVSSSSSSSSSSSDDLYVGMARDASKRCR